MMHLQFYGIPVYPNAIYLMFADSSEVLGTLLESLFLFIIPSALVLPSILLNVFMDKKKSPFIKGFRFLHFFFIFYFIYNPIRTYATGNTWGRQPSTQEFLGTNIYLSLSYFSGKILPYKLSKKQKTKAYKPHIEFKPTKPFPGNIIFILGESLSSNHISLFGYKRQTTPFLNSLKNNPHFLYREGISSGVSTDIAVAMLMNNTYGLRGAEDISSGKRCLFNLAKRSQFKTHFYSTQSQEQLRYITNSICLRSIDHYKSLEEIEPNIDNPNKANDFNLIDQLPESDEGSSQNFFILHQRGSHSPYNLRYSKEFQKFPPKSSNYNQDRINQYDNTVLSFDSFMKKIITKIQQYKKPTILLYVSDHGEGLGEEGVWGHAALKSPSFKVPVFLYRHNISWPESISNMPKNPTHFNLSLFISKLLGHKQSQYDILSSAPNYQILGNDLDGFAGYLETLFEDGELKSITRKDI